MTWELKSSQVISVFYHLLKNTVNKTIKVFGEDLLNSLSSPHPAAVLTEKLIADKIRRNDQLSTA